jgi:hypothetical protein
VTFFDISSKKILFTERMVGNGGGAGTKSFWVNAMFHIFEQIDRKKYGPWKKEFGAMTGTAYNYPDADINNNSQQKTVKQDNVIQKTTNNTEENKEVKNTPVKTVKVDYTKLSTEELKTQLDKALATEDYKNAALIQQELDNRSKVDKYSSMPVEDLNKQLKVALENEEYEKAAAIQAELDKRK